MNGITTEPTSLLDGFQFVESDGAPFVTLDNQRRFYLNATTRRLLNVKPYDRLSIAYNASEQALAIIKAGANVPSQDAAISQYFVDKRYYLSARHFTRTYVFSPASAPYYFDYDRGATDGSVFIFRLRQVR